MNTSCVEQDKKLEKENREYNVKVLQMMFHFSMACVMFAGIDPLFTPINATEHQNTLKTNTIATVYLVASTYNTILYFWDPVESTRLQLHHLLSIFLGTVFAIANYTDALIAVLFSTYIWDSFLFVSSFERSQRSSACLRSMIKAHHMVTILLLAISWSYNVHFYGIFVMFIHDLTDVPMFVVRLLRLKNPPDLNMKQMFVVPVILFTWLYYRVFLFGQLILDVVTSNVSHLQNPDNVTAKWCCILGMSVLWCFNVYWTALVAKKTVQTIVSQDGTKKDDNE